MRSGKLLVRPSDILNESPTLGQVWQRYKQCVITIMNDGEVCDDVLTKAIAKGGSTLRDYVQASGELGYFQHEFVVYGREGDACHRDDGGTVRRIVQGGRSTWFCPLCQK